MKFMGYTRVSTEEQALSGLSLAYQKDRIIAQCKASDLDLDEIVEDAGKSGRDLKRPGLQRILDLAGGRRQSVVFSQRESGAVFPRHEKTPLASEAAETGREGRR